MGEENKGGGGERIREGGREYGRGRSEKRCAL